MESIEHKLKTNANTTRLEGTTRRHDFTRLIEGRDREASSKANLEPYHRHKHSHKKKTVITKKISREKFFLYGF